VQPLPLATRMEKHVSVVDRRHSGAKRTDGRTDGCENRVCRSNWAISNIPSVATPQALRQPPAHAGHLCRCYADLCNISDAMQSEKVAEREGFEPSRRLPAYTLSRRAPSTTRPSLRIVRRRFGRMDERRFDAGDEDESSSARTRSVLQFLRNGPSGTLRCQRAAGPQGGRVPRKRGHYTHRKRIRKGSEVPCAALLQVDAAQACARRRRRAKRECRHAWRPSRPPPAGRRDTGMRCVCFCGYWEPGCWAWR
jgi:hypothetical protein